MYNVISISWIISESAVILLNFMRFCFQKTSELFFSSQNIIPFCAIVFTKTLNYMILFIPFLLNNISFCFVFLFVFRVADRFQRRLKLFVTIVFFLALLIIVWISCMRNGYLPRSVGKVATISLHLTLQQCSVTLSLYITVTIRLLPIGIS